MYQALELYFDKIKASQKTIQQNRRVELDVFASYLNSELIVKDKVQLNFICTHNSRRSHLGQIWAKVTASYFGKSTSIETFSGGTEATAFNKSAIESLKRAGLQITNPTGNNPVYILTYSNQESGIECFSKKYDDELNPKSDFIAVMTCDHADENCPFISGAKKRFSITYRDPKESDGTEFEAKTYDERCLQIATEMFYVMNQLK